MTNRLRTVCLCLMALSCGHPAETREVHVAAAANLRLALDEIANAFQSSTGIHLVATVGATAQLMQQIENGAPVDILLSADTAHVDQLIAKGVAYPASRAVYACGSLVLWAPQRPDITGLRDLASPQVRRVGCAKPELAPYGAAAVQALKKAGLWKAVEPKLVYGQSISVAKQFADSGNVAAAFTALALLHGVAGHYVKVDQHLYDPIEQALCIIKNNTEPDAARKFSAFLLGEAGQAILAKYGYTKPSVR